jgi:HK97 family phage prohead protease
VRILLNHEWTRDLGGTKEGTLELYEDAIGLHARATITDKEVIEEARAGDLVGWSFGFTDREVETGTENGMTVRNVRDLDLYEVSLIDRKKVPAYDGTLVAVRTADNSTSVNIADVVESDINLRVEEQPETKEDNHADEKGAVDYTIYKKMIDEMKGDL